MRLGPQSSAVRLLLLRLCYKLNPQRLPGLRISVLREIPDDPVLRDQWNALAAQVYRPQVFYTYEWARAVQIALRESLHPLLLLAQDDREQLVGVAALATSADGTVSFLCATTGDYCDFLARAADASSFVQQTLQTLRQQGYRDIVLTNFPADSPSFAALRNAATGAGFRMFARTAYLCAQVELASFERDPAGRIKLPRQKMVRRCLKAMAEDGPVATVHQSDWEHVGPALPEFFRAHVARFLYTGRTSNLVRPERRQFLLELARLLSVPGWLCFSRINAGTRTISWNYGFKFDRSWFWYQPTFINDLEKYSPGFVLLSKLIEEAAVTPSLSTVDMGLGAEGYKERFSNATRRTMYVTLHRSLLRHWQQIVRDRVAAAITASPRLENPARALIVKLNALALRWKQSGIAATAAWALRRTVRALWSREEVFFFEAAPGEISATPQYQLQPITYELLADTAIQYHDDSQTQSSLLRSAARLRSSSAQGYALVDDAGRILHLAWVAPFAGFFLAELQHTLDCPDLARVMLFDCWTPVAQRGHGYYAESIQRVAQLQRAQGKRPWIFSAATNTQSRNGILKAGFPLQYSLVRRTRFGWHSIGRGSVPQSPIPEVADQP